ncbi:acyloxyacyl hydrolase [Foetidibacter luteolus]|uniref:acyloxyacyl hydrolase n=1 Tax=Foetidibacter luteolus TaxID=2608880 RepID=UPI00129A90B6|nr:acyloxyacyl hydrolase [Foetidibacter luteolus]
MKHKLFLPLFLLVFLVDHVNAQFAVGDKWYNNPLGFKPLNLHTSMGVIVPTVAAGTALLLTTKDSTLQRKLSIYNETGFSWGYKYPYTFLPQNSTGINYQLRKWMSVGVELSMYFPRDDFNKTTGVAIRPFARFYPVNKKSWRFYFESGGGFIYLIDEFPLPTDQDNRLGTQFNGVTRYGLGTEINLSHSAGLMLGVRHLHISNGNSKGVERNPSHDSNGFFVGFAYRP